MKDGGLNDDSSWRIAILKNDSATVSASREPSRFRSILVVGLALGFRDREALDILPAMNGGDSYGVPAGFAGISSVGSSRNHLTSAEDYEEAYIPCRRERQSLTPA